MFSARNWIVSTLIASIVGAASLNAQASATICKDGTTSTATGRGACPGHGGVDHKASSRTKKVVHSETKAAKAVTKKTAGTQLTRICADGTTSTATGRGACSGHGGVKGAEATSKTTGTVVPAPSTAAPPTISPVPNASPRAQTRASTNSQVRVASGAGEDNNPVGAIAQCKDGMCSHATHRRGACSRHGGVANWL